MFEVLGEDLVFELVFVLDNKGVALISPVDDIGVDWVFQDAVGLDDEVGDL